MSRRQWVQEQAIAGECWRRRPWQATQAIAGDAGDRSRRHRGGRFLLSLATACDRLRPLAVVWPIDWCFCSWVGDGNFLPFSPVFLEQPNAAEPTKKKSRRDQRSIKKTLHYYYRYSPLTTTPLTTPFEKNLERETLCPSIEPISF